MKVQSLGSLRLVVLVSLSCVVLPAPPPARASLISSTGGGAVCGRTGAPVCNCGHAQRGPQDEAHGLHGLEALGGVAPAGILAAGPAGPIGTGAVFQVNLVSGPNRFVPEELTI